MDKINKLHRNGTTIVFVSHDMDAVRNLCERAMFLNNGEVVAIGGAEKVVNTYLDFSSKL